MMRIDACNKQNLTMQSLAEKIGMSRTYLQAIKAGTKGQTLDNLKRIAGALGCYPSDLLPESWQKPRLTLSVLQKQIEQVLDIYESLKEKEELQVNAWMVSKIISTLGERTDLSFPLDDEEIRRYFKLLANV